MSTFLTVTENMKLSNEFDSITYYERAFSDPESYIFVLDSNALIQTFQFDDEALKLFEEAVSTKKYFGTRQIEIEFLRNKDFTSNFYWIVMSKKMSNIFDEGVTSKLRDFIT